MADWLEEGDVRYSLRACAHHLDHIARLYATTTVLFEQQHPVATSRRGNTGGSAVYFEVDAFITSGRRFYEHLRRLVWKRFNGTGSRPDSFSKLLSASGLLLPDAYRTRLEASWTAHGKQLKGYRD